MADRPHPSSIAGGPYDARKGARCAGREARGMVSS